VRFQLRQNWLSWGDSYVVKDEAGRELLHVQGAGFTWGNQLTIRESNGLELAEIKQIVFSWGPTYEIYRNGVLAARMTKELFTFFRCRFSIDVPGPNDLVAEGDFWQYEFAIRRGGELVATVSKQWFTWTDAYGVEVAPREDTLLVLACAVVIDCCCHGNRSD